MIKEPAFFALLLLFTTAIATLFTVIGYGHGFLINMIFSDCITFGIILINAPLIPRIARGWRRLLTFTFTLPTSVLLGSNLAYLISGIQKSTDMFWQIQVIGLMFGVVGVTVFMLADRVQKLDAEIRQRCLDEAERSRREMEAHLKLLQAQIEPHFLFNTLANVASLIETDAACARILLDRLIDWLRFALIRVRKERATLEDELHLLENWLEIVGIRFGTRLRWLINATQAARKAPFPPMLLQPLLENAVKHGIEPKLGGGEVRVNAQVTDSLLRIEVNDDGVGLSVDSTGSGAGLENVRSRLAALYGKLGHLSVTDNEQGGVTALLEMPCVH
jgi:sensor histidine kinase YesM